MMKFSWITRSLQASVVASSMLLVLPAGAQTPATDTPAPAATPAAQAAPATPRMQNRPHRADRQTPRHTPAQRHNQRSRDRPRCHCVGLRAQCHGTLRGVQNAARPQGVWGAYAPDTQGQRARRRFDQGVLLRSTRRRLLKALPCLRRGSPPNGWIEQASIPHRAKTRCAVP